MSRTLFWYIFVDLFKVFMMTNGALAGIMSFGGMLKPLMQGGLDAGQVVKMLGYLSPAMSAYTFPIAALFATTVVYGRLSADNEIVAARAGGISHFSIAIPAITLGLIVSLASMAILCFVVPKYTLKVEKVIYSNIAQIVANQISRNHQLDRVSNDKNVVVYAQDAHVLEPADGAQRLVMVAPMIVRYEPSPTDKRLKVPIEFYTARQATVFIRQSEDDQIEFSFTLDGGMRLPRQSGGGMVAGIGAAQFGPIVRDSMIKENTKFMVLDDLKRKLQRPWTSTRINRQLEQFVSEDQQIGMASLVDRELRETGNITFSGGGETYQLSAAPGTTIAKMPMEVLLTSPADSTTPTITLLQTTGAPEPLVARARKLRLRSTPLPDTDGIHIDMKLDDVTVTIGNDASRGKTFERSVVVPMPPEVKSMEGYRKDPYHYASLDGSGSQNQKALGRDLVILKHDVISELHSRSAFAVSCFVLVIVGCVMGMMFKSGNFLTAFAVSFIPALMCITLIIAGQRTSGNVSWRYWEADSSLQIGIALIWTGVVVIGALGSAMLWRLNRT